MAKLSGLLIVISLVGCSSSVTPRELPGTYVANSLNGDDTIVVTQDGTYIHSYAYGGSSSVHSGGWTMEPENDGETRVTFDHFIPSHGPSRPLKPGAWAFWPASVEKKWGAIHQARKPVETMRWTGMKAGTELGFRSRARDWR
jgi:hypothetical protein